MNHPGSQPRNATAQVHRIESATPRIARYLALLTLLLTVLGVSAREAAGAVIFVTTVKQKVGLENGGGCSLQEAIYSANLDESKAVDYSDDTIRLIDTRCVAGSGSDTIVLPARALFEMSDIVDDAFNPYGPAATPIVTSSITIEAHGATLERTGDVSFRAFVVELGGHLTLRSAHIRGFIAKGGDGGGAGGGGLGAGGAIYVYGGGLVIEGSTFEGNGAIGGNGGTSDGDLTFGGGGGIGGNGQPGGFFTICQGGAGGGGSRGNGGATCSAPTITGRTGGGGGGTLENGSFRNGGFDCGGDGGFGNEDGQDATCRGGGGGGAGMNTALGSGNGGDGDYGGGGGGGSDGGGDGGDGGFGGGGGAGWASNTFGADGGDGGFGGGGGASGTGLVNNGDPGESRLLGGRGTIANGGGGAALGGAIFSHAGSVLVRNSTFTRNFISRGWGGGQLEATAGAAQNGTDAGGAIFSVNGHLSVVFTTVSDNEATGSGGGIVAIQTSLEDTVAGPTFNLQNTILANNGARECWTAGTIATDYLANLIEQNDNCGDEVSSDDPQLGVLAIDPSGTTPTMAIGAASPALNAGVDTGDPDLSVQGDQRGVDRPQGSAFDIGSYEACIAPPEVAFPCDDLVIDPGPDLVTLTIQVSGSGTTQPAPGAHDRAVDSVVLLFALPGSGYKFSSWTGDAVADPTDASTAVVMDSDKTVVANFVPMTPAEWGEQITEELEEILEDAPPSNKDKLDDALAHVRAALLKMAQTPPDRQGAIAELKNAVTDLEAAVSAGLLSPADAAHLMDEICGLARLIAQQAIDAAIARGGKPATIADAEQAVVRGDFLRASLQYKDTLVQYRHAVVRADTA